MNQTTSEKDLNFFFYLWGFENFSILTLKARYLKNCLSHCFVIRLLEKCCMPSAYLQWQFHSGERVVARGSLVLFIRREIFMLSFVEQERIAIFSNLRFIGTTYYMLS